MIVMNESSVIYIDNKQLEDAFPALYHAYKSVFGSQRPKISVYSEESYVFHGEIQNSITDYFLSKVIFLYKNGKVVSFDSSDESPLNHELSQKLKGKYILNSGCAVMECETGHYKGCSLYVSPDFMNNQTLPDSGKGDLSLAEQFVLLIIKSTVSAYRFEAFSRPHEDWTTKRVKTNHNGWDADKKELLADIKNFAPTYKEAWKAICLSLQSKGFAKVNSAGSVQLTLNGKNKASAITGSQY